jgi:RNA polymerase sigma-70 factor (sigma-E family)
MDELRFTVDAPAEASVAVASASIANHPGVVSNHPGEQDPAVRGVPTDDAGAATKAFGDFYAGHYADLVRLATLLSGSADVAPDLVQDCFVGLHKRWTAVHDPLPYVRRSVVHACASHHRRNARIRRLPLPVHEDSALGADELEDAVAKLPARQRAAVVLRYYGDLSDADIARALRCRPGTVRSLIHRALAELRKVIEP